MDTIGVSQTDFLSGEISMTFDLEKAIAVDIDLLAATDWGELRARYRAALAEIERLRANEKSLSAVLDRQVQEQAARIKELEGMLSIRTEELDIAHSVARSEKEMHEKELAAFARRIKELEDALVEGLTNFLHYRASCYDPARRCPYAKECDDCSTWDACGHVEKFRSEARQLLQAEGKIGPGGMHENHQSF